MEGVKGWRANTSPATITLLQSTRRGGGQAVSFRHRLSGRQFHASRREGLLIPAVQVVHPPLLIGLRHLHYRPSFGPVVDAVISFCEAVCAEPACKESSIGVVMYNTIIQRNHWNTRVDPMPEFRHRKLVVAPV